MEDKLEGFEYRNENHEQLPLKPEVGEPEIKKKPAIMSWEAEDRRPPKSLRPKKMANWRGSRRDCSHKNCTCTMVEVATKPGVAKKWKDTGVGIPQEVSTYVYVHGIRVTTARKT